MDEWMHGQMGGWMKNQNRKLHTPLKATFSILFLSTYIEMYEKHLSETLSIMHTPCHLSSQPDLFRVNLHLPPLASRIFFAVFLWARPSAVG